MYFDKEIKPINPKGNQPWIFTGTDLFQIGKGVCQGCILSPCLFYLYAEYIMRNAGLDEAQSGIKIAGSTESDTTEAT